MKPDRDTLCLYECCRCKRRWRGPTRGPELPPCVCGSIYIKWLNYNQLRKELGWP